MMDVSAVEALGLFAVTATGGWLGSYLSSYAGKKGENKAMHEDIKKLVDLVGAVTLEQEKIKAAISGDLWNSQSAWTMKRDAYVDLLAATSDLVRVMGEDQMIDEALRYGLDVKDPRVPASERRLADAWQRMNRAIAVGRIAFDAEAVAKIDAVRPKRLTEGAPAMNRFQDAVSEQARRELKIQDR